MNATASPFPVALPRRSRRRFYLLAALPILSFAGALPILDIAQASRQGADPAPDSVPTEAERTPSPEAERPATITLGALIEMQRRARERRRALTQVEQLAKLPSGEAWQAQLGAFSSPEAAERQRAQLIEAGVPVVIRRAGELHRLQSLPAPRDATETLCARAQAKGVDCFVRGAI